MVETVPLRSAIPLQYTWDPSSIFATDAEWEQAIERVQSRLPELSAFQGRLSEGAPTLLAFLQLAEQVQLDVGQIMVYANMFYSVDTTDQSAVAKRDRAQVISARAMASMAFADPEVLAIGAETLRRWMDKDPRLAVYAMHFDKLERRRPYIRSVEVEQLLRQLVEPFGAASATHGVLANAELRFADAQTEAGEPIEVAQGNIGALLTHPDRTVRRTAWQQFADAHLDLKNTMANCFATGVKQNVFLARSRGYASALEASLLPNYIPIEVFHNLIATFRKHIPIWHRYWRVRREALGYDALHAYDIKAPLTSHAPKVSFEQACDWIAEGMRPLGDEYVSVMRKGLHEQRWVDVYPNKGKRFGAFSTGVVGTHPFILMSYTDDLFSLSTLAHELGHSMHKYYTCATQPFVYANYSLFVAEVASNFNQALVRAHLLNHSDDPDFQIAVIEEAMANFHRYFLIMPTLARFELEAHQRVERGEALTASSLIELMTQLFAEVYGDEVVMDAERVGITWAQFSTHLYANFYTYQYATGISAAHALAKKVLSGEPRASEHYLSFLKAGSSLYPLDALKLAGVDMTSTEPVEQSFAILAELVGRLEQLVKQRCG